MSDKRAMLTAAFRDRQVANRAYAWLQDHGYSSNDISVLMSDSTRDYYTKEQSEGRLEPGSLANEGVAAGGAVGTAVGATLGAILATVLVPGIGWVAGPIIAALAGGGAGAVTGGSIGGLIGLGISEPNAKAYEASLRNGGVVYGVVPRSAEDAKVIRKYFEDNKADNIINA